jgi:Flp pilus assembly pilin Flp
MLKLTQRILKCKKGAALVEYALLVAGVALIGAASVAIFGHKTNDMIAMTAAVLPGAHFDDNAPIVSGKIIETAANANGENAAGDPTLGIGLDVTTIIANSDGAHARLGDNVGTNDNLANLVLEAGQAP